MKLLLCITFFSLFAFTHAQTDCSILGATDKAILDAWYTGLTVARKDLVKTYINGDPLNPNGYEWCPSKGYVGCQTISGNCRVNRLTFSGVGNIGFPTALGTLQELRELYIARNSLVGTVPTNLFASSAFPKLEIFDVSTNSLSGTVPTQYSTHAAFKQLFFSDNTISGTVPTQFSSLSSLSAFKANKNKVVGSLPIQWQSITTLTTFDVSQNKISGVLPDVYSSLINLSIFSAGRNSISGTFPSVFKSWNSITTLELEQNSISGTLPIEFNDLTDTLQNYGTLRLNGNKLGGTLPSTLAPTGSNLYSNLFLLYQQDGFEFCPKPVFSNFVSYAAEENPGDHDDYYPGCLYCNTAAALANSTLCPNGHCENDWDSILPNDPDFLVSNGLETGHCECDAPFVALGDGTCGLATIYYVQALTLADNISQTTSNIHIMFRGIAGGVDKTTSYELLSTGGFVPGLSSNISVSSLVSVGSVHSIYIQFQNPNDRWRVSDIWVTHLGVTTHYKIRVAVRNQDLLEAPFHFSVKTSSALEDGTTAKVYAVLRDSRGYQQNLNFNKVGVAPGEVISVDLTGYNLEDVQYVFLGHYSIDDWNVDYAEVQKRGQTYRYTFNKSINKKNRPVKSSLPVLQP